MAQSPDIKSANNTTDTVQSESDRKTQSAINQGAAAERSATPTVQTFARQGSGAAQQASQQLGETARQTGSASAKAAESATHIVTETARRNGSMLADGQQQIMEEIAERFEVMGRRLARIMEENTADLRTLVVPSPAATESLRELQTGMANLASGVVQSQVRATREFFRLADPTAVFDLQNRFGHECLDAMTQGTSTFIRVRRQTAEQALRSLESRIEERQRRVSSAANGYDRHYGVVADVMSRDVRVVNPDDTVQQATRVMREEDVGVLPVGEGDRLVGIVTDRDVTVRLVAEGKDPARTKVREVMSQDVKYVFEDEDLEHVADNMAEQQVRRLPVVNRNKRLVGVVSLGDLAGGNRGINRAGRAERGVTREINSPASTAAE